MREAPVVLLAGSAESAAERAGSERRLPGTIDLTHAAEDHPRSLIRAPFVEPAGFRAPDDAVHLIAHPAAIAIAMVLPRLHAELSRAAIRNPISNRPANAARRAWRNCSSRRWACCRSRACRRRSSTRN